MREHPQGGPVDPIHRLVKLQMWDPQVWAPLYLTTCYIEMHLLFCCQFSQFGETPLELHTNPAGLPHAEKSLLSPANLATSLLISVLHDFYEQTEKHQPHSRSLGHNGCFSPLSIGKFTYWHLLSGSWSSTSSKIMWGSLPFYSHTVEFSHLGKTGPGLLFMASRKNLLLRSKSKCGFWIQLHETLVLGFTVWQEHLLPFLAWNSSARLHNG